MVRSSNGTMTFRSTRSAISPGCGTTAMSGASRPLSERCSQIAHEVGAAGVVDLDAGLLLEAPQRRREVVGFGTAVRAEDLDRFTAGRRRVRDRTRRTSRLRVRRRPARPFCDSSCAHTEQLVTLVAQPQVDRTVESLPDPLGEHPRGTRIAGTDDQQLDGPPIAGGVRVRVRGCGRCRPTTRPKRRRRGGVERLRACSGCAA